MIFLKYSSEWNLASRMVIFVNSKFSYFNYYFIFIVIIIFIYHKINFNFTLLIKLTKNYVFKILK